ncbi:MAG: YbgA family protein [Candidatus Hodarchaeota archaeon]
MGEFVRPKVVISRCIEFENVRWNAQIIRSEFVQKLIPHIEHVTVCPEFDIGLGVPRDPLRVVKIGDKLRLIQPATEKDLTEKMQKFTRNFLDSLGEIDGFILKSKSPSSGLRDVKIYPALKNTASIGKGPGFFGSAVKERYSYLALEDEGRLRNSRIREHFLRKLFTLAAFRETRNSNNINQMIKFHTDNELLLKSYNQKELRVLSRIVARQKTKPLQELIEEYSKHFYLALRKTPRCNSYINVLNNAIRYFSNQLSENEKSFFFSLIKQYRNRKVPLIALIHVVKSWIVRFDEDYLKRQTFFHPYPEDLLDVDSIIEACGDRDYWKEE